MRRRRTTARNITQFSLVLTEQISEIVRRYCFEERITISEVFEDAVVAYLVEKGKLKNG